MGCASGSPSWTSRATTASPRATPCARASAPAPLELSEIQFHPKHDEGEWVELRNRSPAAVALSGWVLRDRSGTRGVPQGDPICAADSLVVLAQDPAALVAAYPGLDAARVVETKPWPALNNTNDDSGVADALELLDPDALPSDQVAYSAAGVPAGVPLERGHDGRWRTAIDPAGTPLAPARELPALGGTFAVVGPRIAAGTHAVRIAWSLPWESARIRIDAYDLAGARIAGLLADTDVPGRGESDVAVDPLGPGLAVLVLRARALSGHRRARGDARRSASRRRDDPPAVGRIRMSHVARDTVHECCWPWRAPPLAQRASGQNFAPAEPPGPPARAPRCSSAGCPTRAARSRSRRSRRAGSACRISPRAPRASRCPSTRCGSPRDLAHRRGRAGVERRGARGRGVRARGRRRRSRDRAA
jgi:hypothetical protein